MPTYAPPKILQTNTQPDTSLPNFYVPPSSVSLSSDGPLNANYSNGGVAVPYAAPNYSSTRPGTVPPPSAGAGVATIAENTLASPASNPTPTTDTASNVVSTIGGGLAGAASGALTGAAIGAAGGPIGAGAGALIGGGIGVVTAGLNAWLGNRAARSARDRQNALIADQNRINAQNHADDLKYQEEIRSDNLATAAEKRREFNVTTAMQKYKQMADQMQTMIATNQALKDHFAKMGY